jgi:outer membrane receptor protein involved in Fe transport
MGLATVRLLAALAAGLSSTADKPQTAPSQIHQPATASGEGGRDVIVVSASRREEQLRNAPATMTVLSGRTIDEVPGRTVTDLLRHVPGVNVSQTSARDVNVTPRAATGTLSDSLLVLLDGRSLYQDFFGAVLWDFLPIGLDEIKQVEVIRGPASAVWGANAMNGVVNVISKTPREMQGTSLGIGFGQFNRTPADASYDGGGLFSIDVTHAAATSDRFAYKVSAGLLTEEAFLRPTGTMPGGGRPYPAYPNTGTTQPRLDARVDYDLADGTTTDAAGRFRRRGLVLAGGIAGTEGMIHTGLGPLDIQRGATFKYGRIAYTDGPLEVRAFVNALDGEVRAPLLTTAQGDAFVSTFENQAYDVEVSNLLLVGMRHVVSYGGNYRYNNFDLSLAPRGTRRNEGGAYVQDEIVFTDRFRWIVGLRLDAFDVLSKAVFSPRTTLLFKPRPDHTVRLSYNRAFRAPSFVNSYIETNFRVVAGIGPGGPVFVPVVAVGNDDLREEGLTAYEAAYSATFGRVTAGAAAYVNQVKNAIQFTQISEITQVPIVYSYSNFERITERGFEVSLEARLTSDLSAFANYSWQDEPSARGVDLSELNVPPRHRLNAGIHAARGRYFGSLAGRHVDAAYWQDVQEPYVGTTAAYTVIDASLGVHSSDRKMTVTARGTNLLNSRVQEHAFGDIIRRAVTGEIRFRF